MAAAESLSSTREDFDAFARSRRFSSEWRIPGNETGGALVPHPRHGSSRHASGRQCQPQSGNRRAVACSCRRCIRTPVVSRLRRWLTWVKAVRFGGHGLCKGGPRLLCRIMPTPRLETAMAQPIDWSPFKFLLRIGVPVGSEDLFRDFGLCPAWRMPDALPDIRIDASEDGKSYGIGVVLPGLKNEDIKVSIDGRQVMVGAIARRRTDKNAGTRLFTGHNEGPTCRSFTLPQEVHRTSARTRYENGVLSLCLLKKSNDISLGIAGELRTAADPGRHRPTRGRSTTPVRRRPE